jgi:very-short-patch-repair endonuclease
MGDRSRFSSHLRDGARDMRREPTLAEKRVWELLRDRRVLGLKFRRQVPIDNYIVLRVPNGVALNDRESLVEMIRSIRPSPGASRRPLPEGEA